MRSARLVFSLEFDVVRPADKGLMSRARKRGRFELMAIDSGEIHRGRGMNTQPQDQAWLPIALICGTVGEASRFPNTRQPSTGIRGECVRSASLRMAWMPQRGRFSRTSAVVLDAVIVVVVLVALLLMVVPATASQNGSGAQPLWWDDEWWNDGILYRDLANHRVTVTTTEFANGDVDIPMMVARPDDTERYPAILWVHGRRGLDDLARLHVQRLAARGFVVAAPDLYTGRFIEPHPLEHDEVLEKDLNLALDQLLQRQDISGSQACLVSITRGGYKTLRVAVTYQRQERDVACWVGYYPHLQNPNLGEPYQVYRYAPEFDDLSIPTMILIGDQEQYQRMRSARMAAEGLQRRGGDVKWIEYPGVGRGFDFRNGRTRTFADDLAARDAMLRVADFVNTHLPTNAGARPE